MEREISIGDYRICFQVEDNRYTEARLLRRKFIGVSRNNACFATDVYSLVEADLHELQTALIGKQGDEVVIRKFDEYARFHEPNRRR